MICVECGRPVNDVYKEFGRGSGNIRLTRCDFCHKIADKYVEYELVIVFLDLFLHRPQAYRHLLFNRMEYRDSGIDLQYMKVLVVYIFFEAYIKWLRLKEYCEYQQPKSHFYYYDWNHWQDHLPPDRYWFILLAALVEFAAFVLGIAFAVRMSLTTKYAILKYNYLVMAIILSSFGKGLLILMMIWDYPFTFSTFLNIFVLTSNVVALKVFLDTSTLKAILYVAFGFAVRSVLQMIVYLFDTSFLCIAGR